MLNKKKTIVGLGELLWDLFPAGKQLGGAPANFAYITSLLGDDGIAVVLDADVTGPQAAAAREAEADCPSMAISVEES